MRALVVEDDPDLNRQLVGALTDAGFAVDYLEARHAETLAPITSFEAQPVRLLVAAKIGRTRLIDNMRG